MYSRHVSLSSARAVPPVVDVRAGRRELLAIDLLVAPCCAGLVALSIALADECHAHVVLVDAWDGVPRPGGALGNHGADRVVNELAL